MAAHVISGRGLTPGEVVALARREAQAVTLDPAAVAAMDRAHARVESAARRQAVYGRSTGVGANRDVVSSDPGHGVRLAASHATTGATPYPDDVVRAAVLIRVNQLARGGSGVSSAVAVALVDRLNRGDLPALHRGAALGIGDIGALAELGLALGDALEGPDALALLSSNALTLAECCVAVTDTRALLDVVPVVAALTLTALRGSSEPFDTRVHSARPHRGQSRVAARMRALLDGSPVAAAHVQDSFGLRAFAQVVGPAYEALDELDRATEVDLNAAAESPLVADDAILHNGNWHAMPIALRLDALRLTLYGVATLSAARLTNLMDPELTGLRGFLADGPAGSSGALMLEYVAQDALASLRGDAQPATLGSVSLSHGVENHASFAPQAVEQTMRLQSRLRTVLACELVAACRAVGLADVTPRDLRPAGIASHLADAVTVLPADLADRPLRDDIEAAERLVVEWGEPSRQQVELDEARDDMTGDRRSE
ncbi:MAG TPA: aromatic amino acid ammonia-lyase [Nocardioidaceae bacterium]|nr:aromatic amino acid ammonia-lyase [Nocardioidaceae bacterium]